MTLKNSLVCFEYISVLENIIFFQIEPTSIRTTINSISILKKPSNFILEDYFKLNFAEKIIIYGNITTCGSAHRYLCTFNRVKKKFNLFL